MTNLSSEYHYDSFGPSWSNRYLWKPLLQLVEAENPQQRRIFELGCGSGATADMLTRQGFEVTAIDPSTSGITQARAGYPHISFAQGSAYDDLSSKYGTFPIVVSLEVVEHCYWPRKYTRAIYDLLQPRGVAIISTPYHGYFKNLALALAGKFDSHWSPLWDGGHIKFWSQQTLRTLLVEVGFSSVSFRRVGRIAPLAKSMIAIARK